MLSYVLLLLPLVPSAVSSSLLLSEGSDVVSVNSGGRRDDSDPTSDDGLTTARASSGEPDDYSPLLPSPAMATNGSDTLLVSPALIWNVTTTSSNSSVLAGAILRTQKVLFAWGQGSALNASTRDPTLDTVSITVVDADDSAASLQLHMDESYSLVVSAAGGAILMANTTWGALRGLETLTQLVDWCADGADYSGLAGHYQLRYAPWTIIDRPAFSHRGVMIDTGDFDARPLRDFFLH